MIAVCCEVCLFGGLLYYLVLLGLEKLYCLSYVFMVSECNGFTPFVGECIFTGVQLGELLDCALNNEEKFYHPRLSIMLFVSCCCNELLACSCF